MTPLAQLDRLFQVSLVCLLACGFVAFLSAAPVDPFTLALIVGALTYRSALAIGFALPRPGSRAATAATLCTLAAYAVDVFWVSQDVFAATLRLLLWLAAVKLIVSRVPRDYFYLGMLAFLQLLAASLFVVGVSYLLLLWAFLLLAVLTYSAFEIKQGADKASKIVAGPRVSRLAKALPVIGLVLALGIFLLSVGLFFVIPRAQGAGQLALQTDYSIGFASQVDLGLTGALSINPAPVMHVEPLEGSSVSNLRWRGLRLFVFDGVRWSAPESAPARSLRSREEGFMRGPERRRGEGRRIRYGVSLEPLATNALFVSGEAEQVRAAFPTLVESEEHILRVPDYLGQGLRYEATSWLVDRDAVKPNDVIELFSTQFQQKYLRLPPLDPRIPQLAAEAAGETGAVPLEQARRLETYLKSTYKYALELPARRAEDPLAHFLFERREGHCEYFASAMGVMLRTLGIPSRLVGGFAGGVRNPLTGMHVLRSSDAHSWVEAYIPGYGWLEFDPTPERPARLGDGLLAGLWIYWDAVQASWVDWVVDYDAVRQVELARAVQERSRSTVYEAALGWDEFRVRLEGLLSGVKFETPSPDGWLSAALAALLASLALAAFAWPALRRHWLGRRLRRGSGSTDDRRKLFERGLQVLEKKGFRRQPHETAEELEARLPPGDLSNAFAALLGAYNAARFGDDHRAQTQLPALLQRLGAC